MVVVTQVEAVASTVMVVVTGTEHLLQMALSVEVVTLEDLAAVEAVAVPTVLAVAAASLEDLVHIGHLVAVAAVLIILELISQTLQPQVVAMDKLALQSSRTRRKHKWLLM